jgi:hypothetical protein
MNRFGLRRGKDACLAGGLHGIREGCSGFKGLKLYATGVIVSLNNRICPDE